MVKISKSTIKEIVKKVFLVTFDNQYDLAMTFCRFQEFYESPEFKGKRFTMAEFMKTYANKWGTPKGSFSYPDDWNGFNIPGPAVRDCLLVNFREIQRNLMEPTTWKAPYGNEYDEVAVELFEKIRKKNRGWDFYVIGVHTEKSKAFRLALTGHEVAHGLFSTNLEYKEQANTILKQMTPRVRKHATQQLLKTGYNKAVVADEIHAHCATGLDNDETGLKKQIMKKEMKLFRNLLKKYYRNIGPRDDK